MMERFNQYVEKKKLVVNVHKPKMMVIKKGEREKNYEWIWRKERIEVAME